MIHLNLFLQKTIYLKFYTIINSFIKLDKVVTYEQDDNMICVLGTLYHKDSKVHTVTINKISVFLKLVKNIG